MKSSTRIDSVVFQLTPTRTRCDLVINANGRTEQIASGLLDPFLAHLKSAQEQIGKGGYSITLEPHRGSDSSWFTMGTVERFVRFVSKPEILERVYTIESEISQMLKAISFQNDNDMELPCQVHDHQIKQEKSSEAASRRPNNYSAAKSGSKDVTTSNEEKTIVIYKPDALETDHSNMHGENPKTQLLQVLEPRKSMLQKEQGMAFARAVAAGFDIDHIAPLVSFAECFGATRLMEACLKFMELWKAKHESGQWVEIEAVEAISHADFASMNASAIPNASDKQIEFNKSSEKNGLKPQMDNLGSSHTKEHLLGQSPRHPMHLPWPVHPQASKMPTLQPCPLPMTYYHNYPGKGKIFQPQYMSVDESGLHSGRIVKQRRHSMDNGELCTASDIQGIDASKSLVCHSSVKEEDCQSREVREKIGGKTRKQSGIVVIRSINYIASNKQHSSESCSELSSASRDDDDDKTMIVASYGLNNKDIRRRSKRDGNQKRYGDAFKQFDKVDNLSGHAGDDGDWETFQNFLYRNADKDGNSGRSRMFHKEGKASGRKRRAVVGDNPSLLGGQKKYNEVDNHHDIRGDMIRTLKQSPDGMLAEGGVKLGQSISEMRGRKIAHRRTATGSDELLIHGHDKPFVNPASPFDPYVVDQFGYRNVHNWSSSHDLATESFIVPCRSSSIDQVECDGRMAIDMETELAKALVGSENSSNKIGGVYNYEPCDLNMMPDRGTENETVNHDPAFDYELQAAKVKDHKKSVNGKQGTTKKLDNVQGSKYQKNVTAVTKRGKPSELSPAEEAGARAERLRSFKADPQNSKKAKEEEQIKRLEALKIEQQKRIAARSSSGTLGSSPLPSPQTKKLLPTKLSPASYRGSKFSDTEPGSSSPLQRSTLKTISRLSGDAQKVSRLGRLNFSIHSDGNHLTRSTSSLIELKEENNGSLPDLKASMAGIRRLSEPKGTSYLASSIMTPNEKSLSRRASKGSEIKKTPTAVKSEVIKSTALLESDNQESKGLFEVAQKKSSINDSSHKLNMKSVCNVSASPIGSSDGVSSQNDYEDETVVEKTILMLEYEKPSPVRPASEEKILVQSLKSDLDPTKGKSSKGVAVHPQISPSNVKEINEGTVECQLTKAEPACCAEKVLPNISTVKVTEKPYNAPYARVSSLEDQFEKSEYGKAPPAVDTTTAASELTTVHVSRGTAEHLSDSEQYKFDKMWEVSEKPMEKESFKGLKQLLKFGRKRCNSIAGEFNLVPDVANHVGSIADYDASHVGSSGDVASLKTLISQGEGSSAHTTAHKPSRSFSLLSSFWIKTSEKKLSKLI